MSRHKSNILSYVYSIGLLCLFSCYEVTARSYCRYNVFEFTPSSEKQLDIIESIFGYTDQVELWDPPGVLNNKVLFHVSPDESKRIKDYFRSMNISMEPSVEDLQEALVTKQEDNLQIMPNGHKTDIDLNKFYSVAAIHNYLGFVAKKYPKLIEVYQYGLSYEKHPLLYVKISDGFNNTKPVVLIDCGMSGHHWIAPAVCVHFIHQLTREYQDRLVIRDLLKKFDFLIIPVFNPDGYEHTKIDRLWKLNRNPSHFLNWGVDLAMNFEDLKVSDPPHYPPRVMGGYPGPYPFSEPETQAFRNLNLNLKTLHTTISFHSFRSHWMFPYGRDRNHIPNFHDVDKKARIGVEAVRKKFGQGYVVGPAYSIFNQLVSGFSIDWQYDYTPACNCFYISLPQGKYGLGPILPEEDIAAISEETFDGIVAMLESM